MPHRDPTLAEIAERAAEIRAGWSATDRLYRQGLMLKQDPERPTGIETKMVRLMDVELRNRIYGRARRVPVSP
jgi:hypothetical protein